MLTVFLTAFGLGLLFSAAPGAIFAETVKVGVRGGFRPALAVQIGSLVGDALWAVLGLAGVGLLLQLDQLRMPVGLAGVAYLLWLSYDSWREAGTKFKLNTDGAREDTRRAVRSGVLLSITNPQNIAYWAAIGSAMGAVGVAEPSPIDYGIFFAGFMCSSIVWAFFCAALVDRVFRNAGMRWAALTYRACAVAFLLLALSSLRDVLLTNRRDAVAEPQSALMRINGFALFDIQADKPLVPLSWG